LVGAIPGALPVLAGAAAAGVPNAASLALTGLLFTWQIPHFMAIGWMARDDYARAGFVMMPVIDETGTRTARTALLYAIATQGLVVLVAREANISMWLVATIHAAGTAYVIAALPFIRTRKKEQARRLFFASLVVLPVMLGALLLDVALRS
jgi:heme o synthase